MTKIQLRRDTAANWASANPILASGEPAFETDTGKFKIGDGVTAYNSLPYKGVDDYEDLTSKPQINSITLEGNKTATDLGLADASEIEELGNEVNTLAGDVTNLENNKQDNLTPLAPLTIENKVISKLYGMEYTLDGQSVYGKYELHFQGRRGYLAFEFQSNDGPGFGSSWSSTSIPNYIDIPFTFGQIIKCPSGLLSNKCKAFGKILTDGSFIPIYVIDINYNYTEVDTPSYFSMYNVEWHNADLPVDSGSSFSVANGTPGSSYYQIIDNGSTIDLLEYTGNGQLVASVSTHYIISDSTKLNRFREIQVVRIFPEQGYGTSSNPFPIEQFGLYEGTTPLNQLGDFNNLGDNLFDISASQAYNYLELNIDNNTIKVNDDNQLYADITVPDNITTQGNTFNGASQLVQLDSSGKLPAVDGSQLTNLPGGTAPTNMVTTDTDQTITGDKDFPNGVILGSSDLLDNYQMTSMIKGPCIIDYDLSGNKSTQTKSDAWFMSTQHFNTTNYKEQGVLRIGCKQSTTIDNVKYYGVGKMVLVAPESLYVEKSVNGTFTEFTIYNASLDGTVANLALPNVSAFTDNTLPATGTSATATEAGYLYINKVGVNVGEYISVTVKDTSGNVVYADDKYTVTANQSLKLTVPIPNGCQYTVDYTATGTTNTYRFIKTVGQNK